MVNPQFHTQMGTPLPSDFLGEEGEEEEFEVKVNELPTLEDQEEYVEEEINEEEELNDKEKLPTLEEKEKALEACIRHMPKGEVLRDAIVYTDFEYYCIIRLPEDEEELEGVYVLDDKEVEVVINERNILKLYNKGMELMKKELEKVKEEMKGGDE